MSDYGKRGRLRTAQLCLGLFLVWTATAVATQPPAPPGVTLGTVLAASGRVLTAPSEVPGVVPGWNLISLPKQPADPAPGAAFASLAGHFSRIFAYDACDAADPWKLYDPANPGASDLTVDVASGFWIESTATAPLPDEGSLPGVTTIHLCPGWNLIGFPADEPRAVETVLAPIAGKYARVFGYDPTDVVDPWEVHDVAVPDWANDLKLLRPGRGYWLLATAETDLVIQREQAPLVVSLTAPVDLSVVTAPTDVIGTVTGDSLSDWTLSYRAEGAESWTPLASGTGAVVNGPLGVFDPTLLLNGPYEIELAGTDAQGETTTVQVDVNVEGQMKIGLFTLTFSDLEVALAGLPIEILRTYDSRDKQKGDFGIGWRLELRQGFYKNNRKPGDGWQFGQRFLPCDAIGETRGHQTTIRLSDREIYRFKLSLFQGVPTLGGCFARAHFDFVDGPVPGATLEILGSDQVLYQNGANEVVDPNSLEIYEPRQVRLTTRDGRIFDLDLFQGVTRVEDLNGNALSITPEGITHTSGRTVVFERDGEGRITRITDPEGEDLVYTYDAAGDLVEVRDREDHPTRFFYDARHLLLDIEDARGIKAVRNEYDASGRVIRNIDAFGKVIEYSHDLAARKEVVTNRLLQTREMEYDSRGNLVREVDEAGKMTIREFDGEDRLLSQKDPLGHTTEYSYGSEGDLISVKDPLGNTVSYTYNERGQVLTVRDQIGRITESSYDERGNLILVRDPSGGERRLTYDLRGNVLVETDPEGGRIERSYDGFGNLTRELDQLGHETLYAYDANGNRLTETRKRTRGDGSQQTIVQEFRYDRLGRLVETRRPDGSSSGTVFDPIGLPLVTIDPGGHRVLHRYDPLGREVETTFPDGTKVLRDYDPEGRPIRIQDRAGRWTSYVYDAAGRLVKTIFPDETWTESEYDDAGRLVSLTDARRNRTTYVYDKAGRRIRTVDPLGGSSVIEHDAAGQEIAVTDPNGATTRFEYDGLGRRVRWIYPDQTERRMTYDLAGRRVSNVDEAGKATTLERDALGRLIAVTDALGQVTRFSYDELGNRVSLSDANGRTTRFEYDVLGHLTKRVLPDGASEEMTWDPAGNLLTHRDFDGQVTGYTYDSDHRLIERSHPDGTKVTFAYSPLGRRTRMTEPRGTTVYGYDSRDRLLERTDPDGRKLTYAYDANGNRTELTAHVAGQVLTTRFTYDAANRLDHVVDPKGRVYDHGYDPNGNRTALLHPNDVETTWEYDQRNRLRELTTRQTVLDKILQTHLYTLSATGHRTRIDEQDGTRRSYEYDDLYRLVAESVTQGSGPAYQKSFTYDPVGNRLRQTHVGGAGSHTTDSVYDERDRLTSQGGVTWTWNVRGELTSKAGEAAYEWDVRGRLRSVHLTDGTLVSHTYDADGVRLRTETTRPGEVARVIEYLVDTSGDLSQVVAETENGQLSALYVRGDDLLAVLRPTGDRFYHADGLGSIRVLTDEAGEVTDRYMFSAFGELIGHEGDDVNLFLFAGEMLDPNAGFYDLRARWMDPRSGRFTSSDPFLGVSEDPISLHKYLYARNEPVAHVDPSGLTSLPDLTITMKEMAALSAKIGRVLHSVDKARGFVDAINTVVDFFKIVQSPNLLLYLTDSVNLIGPSFDASEAFDSLSHNLPAILSKSFAPWSAWLVQHGRKVKSLAVFLPNAGVLPQVQLPFDTHMMIGRYPVKLVAGGKSIPGRIIGAGFIAPGLPSVTDIQQVWRMDFHPFHHAKGDGPNSANPKTEIDVWRDPPFHYHVMKPQP